MLGEDHSNKLTCFLAQTGVQVSANLFVGQRLDHGLSRYPSPVWLSPYAPLLLEFQDHLAGRFDQSLSYALVFAGGILVVGARTASPVAWWLKELVVNHDTLC